MSRRFSRFDVYWTKTDKQTDDKQSIYIDIYIDIDKMPFSIYKIIPPEHSGIKIEKLFRNMKNLFNKKKQIVFTIRLIRTFIY